MCVRLKDDEKILGTLLPKTKCSHYLEIKGILMRLAQYIKIVYCNKTSHKCEIKIER